jgi:hypothetical protein
VLLGKDVHGATGRTVGRAPGRRQPLRQSQEGRPSGHRFTDTAEDVDWRFNRGHRIRIIVSTTPDPPRGTSKFRGSSIGPGRHPLMELGQLDGSFVGADAERAFWMSDADGDFGRSHTPAKTSASRGQMSRRPSSTERTSSASGDRTTMS